MDVRVTGRRTVEEHLAEILAAVRPLPVVRTALPQAFGMTLTADAVAAVDIPAFDNSAMDGFAVRHADVADAAPERPAPLRVVADLPAGTADDPPLAPGTAARIMTGAPVPTAADTIVPFEDTVGGLADSLDGVLVSRAPQSRGAFVRRRGTDLRAREVVLHAGTRLGPLQLGALAAAGVAHVEVARAPRVVVVATGSELAAPGAPLRRGLVPESNSFLLTGLASETGARVVHRDTVDDEGRRLRRVLAEFTAGPDPADVVVLSGGVSAGAYEVVKTELADAMTFSSVAMQPGKPQGFGVTPGGALLFGLPGNPVSAAVSFEVFVRPALLALQHRATLSRPTLQLPAAVPWTTPPGRRQYLPAVIDRSRPDAWQVHPATSGGSGSHLAGGLGRAEAYAVVPAEVDRVDAGDLVDVVLLAG